MRAGQGRASCDQIGIQQNRRHLVWAIGQLYRFRNRKGRGIRADFAPTALKALKSATLGHPETAGFTMVYGTGEPLSGIFALRTGESRSSCRSTSLGHARSKLFTADRLGSFKVVGGNRSAGPWRADSRFSQTVDSCQSFVRAVIQSLVGGRRREPFDVKK